MVYDISRNVELSKVMVDIDIPPHIVKGYLAGRHLASSAKGSAKGLASLG